MKFSATLLFSMACLCIALETSYAQSSSIPIIDFDGDGSSDITRLEDQADGSPNELVFRSVLSSTQAIQSIEFGKSSDIPALGDYNGDGKTDLTFVREAASALEWTTRLESETSTIEYGIPNDYVLGGIDVNGDGKDDPCVLRVFELRCLTDTESEVLVDLQLQTGDVPIRMTSANFFGDASQELAFIVRNGTDYRLEVFDIEGTSLFSDTIKESVSIVTYDANLDGLPDLALLRPLRKKRWLYVYENTSVNTLSFTRNILKLGSKGKISSFSPQYDDASKAWVPIFLGKRDQLFVLDGTTSRAIVTTAYEPIDGETLLTRNSFAGTGSTIPEDPSGTCSKLESMADGPNGRLWKRSDHGGSVVLFPQCSFRAKTVKIVKDGELLYTMEYAGLGNPDSCGQRVHFRARDRDPSTFPTNIILQVKTTKNEVYCYEIPGSPNKRVD
ncbi:MAG: VCBS repeat-containing protein [Bdellovibrionales bacterium]|nr:VCBS repeat-containing protein [Bdellovibrionales bacterium]